MGRRPEDLSGIGSSSFSALVCGIRACTPWIFSRFQARRGSDLDREIASRSKAGNSSRRPHRSPDAVLDFSAVVGRLAKKGVAYAACYLETDEAREGIWLQVASDDQAKVYLNGTQVYCYRVRRPLLALDTVGPIALKAGTNVLVFKVVNEGTTGLAAYG